MTKSYHPSREKRGKKPYLRLTWLLDAKQVITDIAHGEVDLDTLKAGASLIPAGKVIKLPKVIKAIGNVGKTGFKKGKQGEKISKSGQAKQTKAKNKGERGAGESGSTTGPYAYLEDGPTVGAGKDFTTAQKQKMLEENMKRNGGVVKSDNPNDYYNVLTKPKKSMKGVTPDPNEWQFDHIIPKDQGGTNSYSNCQIVSRKYNREKWNKSE